MRVSRQMSVTVMTWSANRQEICSCHITNRTARLFIEWLPRAGEFRHEVMQVEDYVRQGALGQRGKDEEVRQIVRLDDPIATVQMEAKQLDRRQQEKG